MIDRFRVLISMLNVAACRIFLVMACVVAAGGAAMIGLRLPFVGLAVLGYMAWRKFRHRPVTDAYGSATTLSPGQMAKGGLLADEGMILGRCLPESPTLKEAVGGLFNPSLGSEHAVRNCLAAVYSRRWQSERLIRANRHVHMLTCSPAGGGKGVATLIPNLLSYRGNCIVVDPKGELFRETAMHRQERFGKKVYRLDPFNVCGPGGDSLNPYAFMDATADDFLDQLRSFANALIIREPGGEKQPHFNDMAELNLTALSAFVIGCEHDPARRHLSTMRGLASSRDVYNQAVGLMQRTDACQGIIRRLGGQIAFPADEEQSSILSTFTRQTAFLDSPVVARNVRTSSFDPIELKTGNVDLFLVLPHDLLASLSRLQRLWIWTVMRRTTSGAPSEKRRILYLLDEMGHIGRMQAIEDAVTLYRGMGVRLWFIFQSLEQVKTCFGDKAGTVLDNIGTQQYYGINSFETAELISKRIGDATVGVESTNDSDSYSHPTGHSPQPQSGSRSRSMGVNRSEIARRLLKPEEILTLDKNICLIFHENLPVCLGRLVRFFEAPEFRRRWWFFGPRGTARPRRLGLIAAVHAGFTLFASTFITGAALILAGTASPPRHAMPVRPSAVRARTVAASPRSAPAAEQQTKAAEAPPWERAPARQRSRSRRRSGGSGFLIKIQ